MPALPAPRFFALGDAAQGLGSGDGLGGAAGAVFRDLDAFVQVHFFLLVLQRQRIECRLVLAGGSGRFGIQFFDMGPKVSGFFFRGAQLAFGFFNAVGVASVNGELFLELRYFELQRGLPRRASESSM